MAQLPPPEMSVVLEMFLPRPKKDQSIDGKLDGLSMVKLMLYRCLYMYTNVLELHTNRLSWGALDIGFY